MPAWPPITAAQATLAHRTNDWAHGVDAMVATGAGTASAPLYQLLDGPDTGQLVAASVRCLNHLRQVVQTVTVPQRSIRCVELL